MLRCLCFTIGLMLLPTVLTTTFAYGTDAPLTPLSPSSQVTTGEGYGYGPGGHR